LNKLDPEISKTKWTQEEDLFIIQKLEQGFKWKDISQ